MYQLDHINSDILANKRSYIKNMNKKAQHRSWHTAKCNYDIAFEMNDKRLRYSHGHAEAVVSQKQFTTALSSCFAY